MIKWEELLGLVSLQLKKKVQKEKSKKRLKPSRR